MARRLLALVWAALCCGAALDIPSFFLLGVQKSSTTFISKLFTRNPALCCGRAKEPHYFDSIDYFYNNSAKKDELRRRYVKNFNLCPRGYQNRTFDATPLTWLMPHRVAEAYSPSELAAKKFIVILRHPVDREYSWYNHQLRSCLHQLRSRPFTDDSQRHLIYSDLVGLKTCSKVLNPEDMFRKYNSTSTDVELLALPNLKSFRQYALPPESLRGDSSYVTVLKKWMSMIRRDQLLVLNFRSSIDNITSVMQVVSEFLALQVPWKNGFKVPNVVSSFVKGSKLDCITAQALNSYYEVVNAGLAELINDDVSAGPRPLAEPKFTFLEADYKCTML